MMTRIKQWLYNKWLKAKRFWRQALAVVGIGGVALVAMSVGAPTDVTTDLSEIKTAQERYIDEHGKYAQVLPCDKPARNPHYQEGRPLSDYGIELPCNWYIIEYETPDKTFGYNVASTTSEGTFSKGYGKEAKSRSYKRNIKAKTSSTTSLYLPDFSGLAKWFEPMIAYAALTDNTHSTVLEADSNQFWSITDANQTGLDNTTDMTISFWCKPASVTGNHYLITKDDESTNRNIMGVMLGDKLRIGFGNGSNTTQFDFTNFFSVDTWVHVVATFDGSASEVRVWKDGTEDSGSSATTDASSIGDDGADFSIGALDGSTGDNFDGLIDDVRVWNTELSDANVEALFDTPCDDTIGSANLQGHWLFDNDGTDETANSNDLTNNNTATFDGTDTAYDCAGAAEAAPPEPTNVNWW